MKLNKEAVEEQVNETLETPVAPQHNMKPSKEEILKFEDDCKALEAEYNDLKPYVIGTRENALKLALTAKKYNSEIYTWRENEYQGVIYFDTTINEIIKDIEENGATFALDKNHLQWLYFILTNKATGGGMGLGLESALSFRDNVEDIKELLVLVSAANIAFQTFVNRIRRAQEVLTAAYQGCYLKDDQIVTQSEFYREDCDDALSTTCETI
ncbi:MAG: hypothetical protein ACRDD8_11030 [Bacteroidales bacterium]